MLVSFLSIKSIIFVMSVDELKYSSFHALVIAATRSFLIEPEVEAPSCREYLLI